MMKKLLSLIAVCAISGTASAQLNLSVQEGIAPIERSLTSKQTNAYSKGTAIAGSCMDTIYYTEFKNYFKATPNTFLALSTVNHASVITNAYTYKNTGTVTVSGLGGWAIRTNGSASSMIPTRLYLYEVNATNQPTLAIDSVDVNVSASDYYYGALSSPKTFTSNFAVGIRNVSSTTSDTLRLILTRAQTAAAATNKFGEALGYLRQLGNWFASNAAFGGTNDYEPVLSPIISYSNMASGFMTASSGCVGQPVTFTNTTVNRTVVSSPMFNLSQFAQMWALTTHTAWVGIDSAFTWIYGDGTPNGYYSGLTHNHTYSSAGTKMDTLMALVTGYRDFCFDFTPSSITINPLPTVSVTATSNTICTSGSGGTSVTLNGTPSGGTYSGTGVSGNSFAAPASAGTYPVMYAFTNTVSGCSNTATTNIVASVCMGLTEFSGAELISVYPNPSANGHITISNLANNSDVEVVNMLGQVVYKEKASGNHNADLSHLNNGSYFVKINANNEKAKIIKLILN